MRFKTLLIIIAASTGIIVPVLALDVFNFKTERTEVRKSGVLERFGPIPSLGTDVKTKQIKQTSPNRSVAALNVPFTPQAPFGNWKDPRQQDGCEEASALMAMRWVFGKGLTLEEAEKEILAISDYELENYGSFHDTSVRDTVGRIFKGYFKYNNVEAKYNITANDIKSELNKGNLIVVPANGQKLKNPYYTPPGPERHMLVVRGYDSDANEFITNDPGTKRGELFRYPASVLMEAIYDYPTGHKEPVREITKAMIVVRPL